MPNERLEALIKQRALLEEHLAWLDSEIESAQKNAVPAPASSNENGIPVNRLHITPEFGSDKESPAIAAQASVLPSSETNPKSAIVDIYDELGPDTNGSVNDARKGCLGFFAAAFIALAAFTTWVWFKY